jgi:hypothetical protein
VVACNLVCRNRILLVSFDLFEPQLPLKNFRYTPSAITIGKICHGGTIVGRSRLQTAIPRELTIKPVIIERMISGIMFQATVAWLENLFCFMINILRKTKMLW